ncbi:Cyclin N-terminal domain-containing protein 1 [Trichoplax sp. H2]|nr:Cyclin N-terminal domain-containing protein 1 [Trichoplax sp. H2]|eukprot:RDD40022.1 Cyclin N-terminal domain-containing protein 1 [Trichoplax sp. H2]
MDEIADPLYNPNRYGPSKKIIADSLELLVEEHKIFMQEGRQGLRPMFFKTDKIAEIVFTLCDFFVVEEIVRYATIEIFNRFEIEHIRSAFIYFRSEYKQITDLKRRWYEVEKIIVYQLPLRILTCLQICAKIYASNNNKNQITVNEIKNLLDRITGNSHASNIILDSEVYVLETLQYDLGVIMPYTFVETLLEALGFDLQETKIQALHKPCVALLDITYMRHTQIYERINREFYANNPKKVLTDLSKMIIKYDYKLLAVAIVTSASFVVAGNENKSFPFKVIDKLSNWSSIAFSDIQKFTFGILEIIKGDYSKVK